MMKRKIILPIIMLAVGMACCVAPSLGANHVRTFNVKIDKSQINGDVWTAFKNPLTISKPVTLKPGDRLDLKFCFNKILVLEDDGIDETEEIGFNISGEMSDGLGNFGIDMVWAWTWDVVSSSKSARISRSFGATGKLASSFFGGKHLGFAVPGNGPGVPATIRDDVEFIDDGTLRVCGATLRIDVPKAVPHANFTFVADSVNTISAEADDGITISIRKQFTRIQRAFVAGSEGNPDTWSVTVTWQSQEGCKYAVYASDNLFEFSLLDDSVIGEEGETSFTEMGVPLSKRARYYQVRSPDPD